MNLEQRLTEAARHVGNQVHPPEVDPEAVRSRALRVQRNRMAAAVSAAGLAAVIAMGMFLAGGREGSDPSLPASSPSSTMTSVAAAPLKSAAPPLDTTSWKTYVSNRYGYSVGHPVDWVVVPASRNWTWNTDVADFMSPAHEAFVAPDQSIRVSVWSVPVNPDPPTESKEYLQRWVKAYCTASGNTPCTGVDQRAVELCLEVRDCHPGLLVPFTNDVQAFFRGRILDHDVMVVVAVWRSESAPAVERYGGAQRLLEGFLSTMEVHPRPRS